MPCCPFLLSGLRSILESDTGTRCRYDCCSRAILRSFNDCCRRNYSSLRQRKLESDADHLSRNGRCRRAIPHCCDDGAAVIRKSGPEIKNRCSNEAVFGQSMQRFASSGLKSRIDARKRVLTRKSLHRFSSLGTKSRINARSRPPSARVH